MVNRSRSWWTGSTSWPIYPSRSRSSRDMQKYSLSSYSFSFPVEGYLFSVNWLTLFGQEMQKSSLSSSRLFFPIEWNTILVNWFTFLGWNTVNVRSSCTFIHSMSWVLCYAKLELVGNSILTTLGFFHCKIGTNFFIWPPQ